MDPGSVLRPLAAGVAVFLVVALVVTELLAPRIEFSVLVGLPAGIVAGLAAAAFVAVRQGSPGTGRRRGAIAFGNAGVAFVVVLVGAVWLLGLPVTLAIGTAAGVAVLAGLVTFVVRG